MILEILSVGIIISACLALFIDEIEASVTALAGTFLFISLLYALNGAIFAAIFQFAIGVGTLAILFLSGEMLSDKPKTHSSPAKIGLLVGGGVVLSLPAIFLSIPGSTSQTFIATDNSFGDSLWNLNGLDVVLQALVVLTVALGIAIILYTRRKGGF